MANLSTKQKTANSNIGYSKISNELIEAFIKKSNLNTLKLLFYISSLKNMSQNNDLFTVEIPPNELCSHCNVTWETIKKNLKSMTEMSISVTDEKKESFITVLPFVEIPFEGKVKLRLFKEIVDLVIDVKRKYTTINIDQIMLLTSKHSIRMLALLEMIALFDEDIPKRKTYVLEELNLLFGVNYKRLITFAKEILEPVKAELDKDAKFSFNFQIKKDKMSKNKVGRASAVSITIDLIDNQKQKQTNEEIRMKKYLEEKKAIYREHEQQGQLGIV